MVELLMALALTTFLLAALSFGMHASFKTYDKNGESAEVTHTARVVITRMISEIRTADSITVNPDGTHLTIVPPVPIVVSTSTVTKIEYEFVTATTGNTLFYKQTLGDGTVTSNVLMGPTDNVAIDRFTVTTDLLTKLDSGGNIVNVQDSLGNNIVRNATVSLLIGCGGEVQPHRVSVAPRRVQIF